MKTLCCCPIFSFKVVQKHFYLKLMSHVNSMLFRYTGNSLHINNKQVTYRNVLHHRVQDLLKESVPLQGPQRQNGKRKQSLSLCDVFQVLNSSISLKIITPERQRSITAAPVWKLPSDGHTHTHTHTQRER